MVYTIRTYDTYKNKKCYEQSHNINYYEIPRRRSLRCRPVPFFFLWTWPTRVNRKHNRNRIEITLNQARSLVNEPLQFTSSLESWKYHWNNAIVIDFARADARVLAEIYLRTGDQTASAAAATFNVHGDAFVASSASLLRH